MTSAPWTFDEAVQARDAAKAEQERDDTNALLTWSMRRELAEGYGS